MIRAIRACTSVLPVRRQARAAPLARNAGGPEIAPRQARPGAPVPALPQRDARMLRRVRGPVRRGLPDAASPGLRRAGDAVRGVARGVRQRGAAEVMA
jgi:hypothetical protein